VRGTSPTPHLLRIEMVVDIEDHACPWPKSLRSWPENSAYNVSAFAAPYLGALVMDIFSRLKVEAGISALWTN
jgi:hypothetical protein